MYQTTYHGASSVDEAAALFAKGTEANKRSIAADDCFKGLFSTALEDGEIITVARPITARISSR